MVRKHREGIGTWMWILILMGAIILGCWVILSYWGNGPSPGEFDPTDVGLVEVPGKKLMELTTESLTFVDLQGVKWIAPKGTHTDGASVPRLALSITDGRFDKAFLKAAIVHDAYCQEFNAERCPEQYRKRPWQKVHRMFYEACVAGETSLIKAKLMFAAVWLAGPRWDDPERDLEVVPDDVLAAGFVGCKNWIEDTDPTLGAIEGWMDEREPAVLAISKLESTAVSALRAGNPSSADSVMQESEAALKNALSESPEDLMLLNLKGYHHKNRAMIYTDLNMDEKAIEEFDKAEDTYKGIITREPKEPGALKGLGSVMILRNDLDRAEVYVRRALEVAPEYPGAKLDLERIETMRKSGPPK